jgi:hypothetical protein
MLKFWLEVVQIFIKKTERENSILNISTINSFLVFRGEQTMSLSRSKRRNSVFTRLNALSIKH